MHAIVPPAALLCPKIYLTIEPFTFERVRDLVNAEFRLVGEAGEAVDLRLAEATETGPPFLPGGRAPFTLLFRGPPAPILPQRIYTLEHAGLGRWDLFLVPLGPDAEGGRYEAVFG